MSKLLNGLRSVFSLLCVAALFMAGSLVLRLAVLPDYWLHPERRFHLVSVYMKWMARWIFNFLTLGGARVRRSGSVPTESPVVIVANHQSLLDILQVTLLAEPFVPAFVARKRYARFVPLVSESIRMLGCPLVDPKADPRGEGPAHPPGRPRSPGWHRPLSREGGHRAGRARGAADERSRSGARGDGHPASGPQPAPPGPARSHRRGLLRSGAFQRGRARPGVDPRRGRRGLRDPGHPLRPRPRDHRRPRRRRLRAPGLPGGEPGSALDQPGPARGGARAGHPEPAPPPAGNPAHPGGAGPAHLARRSGRDLERVPRRAGDDRATLGGLRPRERAGHPRELPGGSHDVRGAALRSPGRRARGPDGPHPRHGEG